MTNNPYVQQILSQGKEPSKAPAPRHQYPRTIHGRTYQTEAEYTEALHDFLNGMWHLRNWHRGRHRPPPDPLY